MNGQPSIEGSGPTASIVEKQLAIILSRNWWVLLLRGLSAVTFGALAWLLPGISLAALVLLFGVYALADDILAVWTAIAGRKEREHWWILLLWGLLGNKRLCILVADEGAM
jgi:uncharacterized membrane protein HdeD (DUF308 family)